MRTREKDNFWIPTISAGIQNRGICEVRILNYCRPEASARASVRGAFCVHPNDILRAVFYPHWIPHSHQISAVRSAFHRVQPPGDCEQIGRPSRLITEWPKECRTKCRTERGELSGELNGELNVELNGELNGELNKEANGKLSGECRTHGKLPSLIGNANHRTD